MKKLLLTTAFGLVSIAPAFATNVTLDFGNLPIGGNALCGSNCVLSTGGLNSVLDGVSVEGYNALNKSSFLTQKPDGGSPGDESGLGQSDKSTSSTDPNYEIAVGKFVVVDNVLAETLGFKPVSFSIGSLQSGEKGQIFGYNGPDGSPDLIPGDLHLLATFTGTPSLVSFNVSGDGYDKFVFTSIQSSGETASNIVLASEILAAPSGVPEPSTWAMGIMGFAFMGFLGLRKATSRRLA